MFRRVLLLFLLILTLVSSQTEQKPPSQLTFQTQQNIAVTLINYSPSLVDTADIYTKLPRDETFWNGLKFINFPINYEIKHANASYTSLINSYIDGISVKDDTSTLNQTALLEQKDNFRRTDIFSRQNGTAIDARNLESFLSDNLPITALPDDNLFHIFVFNNSRLDFGDYHWFNLTEVDPDAGIARYFWRLEWDDPLNYDVKFPFPAFSEKEEIAILDPTAFQWYLKWRMIWNKDVYSHPTYNETLTEYLDNFNTDLSKQSAVDDTIIRWITDWVYYIFNIYADPVDLGTSLDVQLRVAFNSSQRSQSELEWIINDELVAETTNTLLRTSQLIVNTTFIDINEDTFMRNFLAGKEVSYQAFQGKPSPFANWTYYNGDSIWNAVYGSTLADYFDTPHKTITVKGLILLLDNSSYLGTTSWIPWTGGLYTGLGGLQTVTMLWELDRAFKPDGNHKAGLSKVLVHEIGHSLGLPHTFASTFISDFASDVMGYYPGTANYSRLVTKIYQRNAVFKKIMELQNLYQGVVFQDNPDNYTLLNDIQDRFPLILNDFRHKEYLTAYFGIVDLINYIKDPSHEPTYPPTSQITSTSSSQTSSDEVVSSTHRTSTTDQVDAKLGILVIIPISLLRRRKFLNNNKVRH